MPTSATRIFVPEDVLDYQLITDAQVSPNGSQIAYVVETLDWAGDCGHTAIWLVPTAGGEPRKLTTSSGVNNTPRWSPDSSRIAFVSGRAGALQIFVIPVDGGEAQQVTTEPNGAGSPAWSPDGTAIAFTSAIPVEPIPTEPGELLRASHGPKVVTRAFYKADGFGFNIAAHQQLFVIPSADGKATQLTSGQGNVFSPAWSPDGSRIAFSRTREGILDAHCSDIWTITAGGSDQRRVTSALEAATTPVWSPDGQFIAFTGNENGADAVQYTWLVPATGGTPRSLTAPIDRPLAFVTLGSAPGPAWSPDGEAVYVLLADHGNHRLARVCLDGDWTYLTDGPRQLTLLTADDARQTFVYASCSNTGPRELFVYSLADQRETQVTHLNAEWNRARSWPEELTRTFTGPNGEVYGRVLLPAGPGPHPLLVDDHGGPHSQALRGWEHHPYRYMLASRGWAVLILDPRGSTSYGEAYSTALRGKWGELDFPEVMAAIDQLIEEGVADPEKLVMYGKSYGGFLSAWSLGHTDRFQTLVVSAPVTNVESHFGSSDTGYFVDPLEMTGAIDEKPAAYQAHSPVHYLKPTPTPVLLLHGDADYRTPLGQSEELFHRLLALGCTAEMVIYPGGDHHVIEQGLPSHRVDYNRRVVEWFERHAHGK